jgi:transposase
MTTRVYQFGLLPPTTHGKEVRDLMFTGHRYRNEHTAIERERRAAMREALGPSLRDAETVVNCIEEKLIAVSREIKTLHITEKTLKTPPELTARLKQLKADKKIALTTFRTTKHSLYDNPEVKGRIAAIEERSAERRRHARGTSGLAPNAWGTYQRVEAAADASRKMPLFDGTEPNDPRFRRYEGDGSIAIHLQNDNAMDVADLFLANNWVWVEPVDAAAWLQETPRGQRRRLSRTRLRIRLGANEKREAIMAEFPMIMHREIPAGGVISWAVVQVRKHGPREEWSVSFTVALPDGKGVPSGPSAAHGKGVVAIDLGWRLIPGSKELRVASWYGEDGRTGELRLDPYVLRGIGEIPDGIRSVRDQNFNIARDGLSAWLVGRNVPEWLTLATAHLSQWKSPGKLAKVARSWKGQRFEGDSHYDALEAWRYRDQHLWAYEAGQRRSGLRNRREIYRRFGAELAKNYETVVFEDFDLRRLAKRPNPTETDKAENETARTNRFRASTSELRMVVLNAFSSRGGSSGKVNPVDSTHICRVCGSVEHFDAAAYITHTCSGCGEVWDQDENAARVLFERWRGARVPGSAREDGTRKESKWVRIKREKAEREAAQTLACAEGGARDPAGNEGE